MKDIKLFDEIVKEISKQLHLPENTVIEYIETALATKYSGSRESFEIEDISEIEVLFLITINPNKSKGLFLHYPR